MVTRYRHESPQRSGDLRVQEHDGAPRLYDLAVNEGEGWEVGNGRPEPALVNRLKHLVWRWSHPDGMPTRCRFCGCEMRLARRCSVGSEHWELNIPAPRGIALQFCPRCAHWRFWTVQETCMDLPMRALAVGVRTRFSGDIPIGCHTELAQTLIRQVNQWGAIRPKVLEHFVAEVFRRNYAPCEVTHVGRSGDNGKDLVLVRSDGECWLIQVKGHRDARKAEPVGTIRSLVGTLVDERQTRGIVVTTADAFSPRAYEAVHRYDEVGYRIRLFDRGILRELIGPLVPRRPWESLFDHPDFKALHAEVRSVAEAGIIPDQTGLFD